jgi:hypothetical protein
VIVYYLYPKTNIELNIGLRKMGRAGKQLGKRGNLGGENGGWFWFVGELSIAMGFKPIAIITELYAIQIYILVYPQTNVAPKHKYDRLLLIKLALPANAHPMIWQYFCATTMI